MSDPVPKNEKPTLHVLQKMLTENPIQAPRDTKFFIEFPGLKIIAVDAINVRVSNGYGSSPDSRITLIASSQHLLEVAQQIAKTAMSEMIDHYVAGVVEKDDDDDA